MNAQNSPIGLFDSGIGGTSIWREVIQLLPREHTIYLADSKNAPYGFQAKEDIIKHSIKNTEFLLNQNVKIIVVACNTATTSAINVLRAQYDIPFIGIEPAIKPAGLTTKTKRIGILATKGTLNSVLFEQTSEKLNPQIEIIEQVGEGLVDLIENGQINSREIDRLLKQYLQPMIAKNIDAMVLGCTHYSYLIPKIKSIIGSHIKIIDSGEAVARQTKNILTHNNQLNSNDHVGITHQFYINKKATFLKKLLNNYSVKIVETDF